MRISTSQFHQSSLSSMMEQQVKLNKTQQQLASGRRVLTPADDPAAAARALDLSKAEQNLERYRANADQAALRLHMEETALDQVGNLLHRVRELTVQANNGALDGESRAYIASEVRQRLDQLVELANSVDGSGDYLFAGSRSRQAPFSIVDGQIAYHGDQIERVVQVGATRRISTAHTGFDVFMRIPATEAGGGNRSMFASLQSLVGALESGDPMGEAGARALADLDAGLENLLRVRAEVGGRLNAIDAEIEANEASMMDVQTTLSRIEDLDYAEAISRLNREIAGLQAAQQTYGKVQGLSLFNFI